MCQNAHLSMETAGQAFKCFVIDQPSTSVMEHKQVNFLQGVLAFYVELDEWQAKLSQKNRQRVRGLQTFQMFTGGESAPLWSQISAVALCRALSSPGCLGDRARQWMRAIVGQTLGCCSLSNPGQAHHMFFHKLFSGQFL